jgi:BspA type Leucine rich repeat region (6 copies)
MNTIHNRINFIFIIILVHFVGLFHLLVVAEVNYALSPDGRYEYVTNNSSSSESFIISASYQVRSVTIIGDSAFYICSDLTSITIPKNVISIGASAFEDCRNLSNVAILNSITNFGNYAFARCIRLISITIPTNVTSIRRGAFLN